MKFSKATPAKTANKGSLETQIRELIVSNYADVAAILCSLCIMGYIFASTTSVFAPIVVLSHNVTDGSSGTCLQNRIRSTRACMLNVNDSESV